ncbi:NAD-binding protein [Streptomyces poonensis]|uniref:Potassium transporter TrkA n=1 Tax=Streptomyces poonensis TaxID=68255 RepID=A0A918PL86_9ACTN|nr:NAD-binding protein [Streptomyces poonensis]GGZ13520.1 potassium transporter TrkA [Streptomyces poonensis]GLJ91221.1 potassium transporter TrkA [Streptomyces poonensis]
MVVCGDDGLALRLAAELRSVYREQVVLVVPPREPVARQPVVGRARTPAWLDRFSAFSAVVGRAGGNGDSEAVGSPGAGAGAGAGAAGARDRVVEAAEASEAVLAEAGVERAAALALVYDDDETNIRAALTARRLNPRLRLVLRLYNRRLGQHIEELLDQASDLAVGDGDGTGDGTSDGTGDGTDDGSGGGARGRFGFDASTTVLSDADTAAPALAATAVAGTSKVVQTDGLMLRAVERAPGQGAGQGAGLCTLALLSTTTSDPAGDEGSESSGPRGPRLLPDESETAAAGGRGTVVLETVSYAGPELPPGRAGVPLGMFQSLFSRRLRWSLAGLVACVVALAVAQVVITDEDPLRATYITLLDLFAINEPAVGRTLGEQVLQLLSGLMGLLLLPVLLAAVLEALGTFRSGTAPRKPPRGLSGHVVLLGLGKIGTRVLTRLRELHIPVVCVEADPDARGLAAARRLRVPVILGDVTQEGVLEAAKIHRAHALLALTSEDTTNLEAALYARSLRPDLRVVLRLYDDDFATAVYRTLRAAHPRALTRSRSVSHLAAPAFAGAVMGRQILGAIPVERRVLLFAAVEVDGNPRLEGRTVGEAFRAGAWRVLALDTADPAERAADLAAPRATRAPGAPSGLVWDLPSTYVLRKQDRVVLAATRRGLAELLGRRPGAAGRG